MIWDIERILAEIWAQADFAWDHRGQQVSLLVDPGVVPSRTLILSGTPEVTVFTSVGLPLREPAARRRLAVILGARATYGPDYEGSDDYEVQPLPLLIVQYRDPAFLRGNIAGANLLHLTGPLGRDRIQAGPFIRYVFARDEDDNDALDELGDVDGSVEVGGFLDYGLGPWSSRLTVLQDVAGGHEDLIISLEGS